MHNALWNRIVVTRAREKWYLTFYISIIFAVIFAAGLLRLRANEALKLRIMYKFPFVRRSLLTRGFPSQKTNKSESVPLPWRHRCLIFRVPHGQHSDLDLSEMCCFRWGGRGHLLVRRAVPVRHETNCRQHDVRYLISLRNIFPSRRRAYGKSTHYEDNHIDQPINLHASSKILSYFCKYYGQISNIRYAKSKKN